MSSTSSLGPVVPSAPDANFPINKGIHLPDLRCATQEIGAVAQKARSPENTILAKNITRALGMLAGMGLGVLAGLAVVGIMATPAGWAVLGGVAVLSLAAAFYLGGPKELIRVLAATAVGSIAAFPASISAGVAALTGAYATFTILSLYSLLTIGGGAVMPFVLESLDTNEEERRAIREQLMRPPKFNPES